MSWQFDDTPLLNHLFSSLLPFSLDLQKIVSDYLFRREVIAFEKDGVKCFLRFGPTLISGEIAYEIRAYNQRESHVFSTFKLGIDLDDVFNILREKVVTEKRPWDNIFFRSKYSQCCRYQYVFSPATKLPHMIIYCTVMPGTFQFPLARCIDENLMIDYIDSSEIRLKIKKYFSLIEKYGDKNDWPEKVLN